MFIPLQIETWIQLKFIGEYESMNLILYNFFDLMMNALLSVFVLVIIQSIIVTPLWNKFKLSQNILGLNGFYFMSFVCLACGFITACLLWQNKVGIIALLAGSALLAFIWIGYWVANLLTLKYLEQKMPA
jgi:hypothetical protein